MVVERKIEFHQSGMTITGEVKPGTKVALRKEDGPTEYLTVLTPDYVQHDTFVAVEEHCVPVILFNDYPEEINEMNLISESRLAKTTYYWKPDSQKPIK